MIFSSRPRRRHRSGLTLLELTVVISVLLSLASLLTTGARAWKRGADRAECVLSMRSIQVALRSYQNLYQFEPGEIHPLQNGTSDIAEHLFDRGLIEQGQYGWAKGTRTCQGGGTYSRSDPNRFPPVGQPYLTCSLAPDPDSHYPTKPGDW